MEFLLETHTPDWKSSLLQKKTVLWWGQVNFQMDDAGTSDYNPQPKHGGVGTHYLGPKDSKGLHWQCSSAP